MRSLSDILHDENITTVTKNRWIYLISKIPYIHRVFRLPVWMRSSVRTRDRAKEKIRKRTEIEQESLDKEGQKRKEKGE